MKRTFLSCLFTAIVTLVLALTAFVVGTGYFIGNYAVHFGLERGADDDPKAPPKAYALLMPPDARHFTKPDFQNEVWTMESADGLTLKATRFYPERQSHKWAIVVHGYGCTQENSWYIAANYLMMGYNVLTPDLRASGDSEGQYLTMGYKESQDVVEWAQKIAQADSQAKIVLHGVSMGAATVMIASADEQLPAEVVATVEDCGYTSAYDLLAMKIEDSFDLPSFPVMNLLDWRCEKVAGFSLHQAVPDMAVRHSKVPMLFIHGTKDTLVPPSMAQKLYDDAQAPKKQLLFIKDAIHAGASQQDQRTYFTTISNFVSPYMN